MDVKAINSTQAALDMHTANTEINRRPELDNQPNKKEEAFGQLDPKVQQDLIKQMADKLNQKLQLFDSSLQIEIDKDTGIQVVKIIDNETKEVIRQLPPETMLKIAKYIDEITGLLFEKRA